MNQPQYAYLVLFHPIDKAVVINEDLADIVVLQFRERPLSEKVLREPPASRARRTNEAEKAGESLWRYSAAVSKSSTAAYDQITLRPIFSSAFQLLLECGLFPLPRLGYLA
jgi:hypothetical protein